MGAADVAAHRSRLAARAVQASLELNACPPRDSFAYQHADAIAMLEDSYRIARQVYGASHPSCEDVKQTLESARARLSAQEARLVEDASETLAQGLRIDGDESEAP